MEHWIAGGTATVWLITLLAVLTGYSRLRKTTLVGPWSWMAVACLLLAATYALRARAASSTSAGLSVAAGVTMFFCPNVALLGAKRPQSRAWPYVVLCLWSILLLPAVEASLAGRGVPDMDGPRTWFLGAIAVTGCGNYLATRFAIPAMFGALSQFSMIAVLRDVPGIIPRSFVPLLAASCALAAVLLAWAAPNRSSGRDSDDRLWLRFRDAYGALWALRIAQRVNATAQERNWPGRVAWNGIRGNGELNECLVNLLRSFVDAAWLNSRDAPAPVPTPAASAPPAAPMSGR